MFSFSFFPIICCLKKRQIASLLTVFLILKKRTIDGLALDIIYLHYRRYNMHMKERVGEKLKRTQAVILMKIAKMF